MPPHSNTAAFKAIPSGAHLPRRQKSQYVKNQAFKATVKKLSTLDVQKLIQWQPFERLVRSKLCHGVERASSVALLQLAEAALAYIHEMYEDAFHVTTKSGKRKMLMVRDLSATLHAKGSSVVSANKHVF